MAMDSYIYMTFICCIVLYAHTSTHTHTQFSRPAILLYHHQHHGKKDDENELGLVWRANGCCMQAKIHSWATNQFYLDSLSQDGKNITRKVKNNNIKKLYLIKKYKIKRRRRVKSSNTKKLRCYIVECDSI